MKKIFFLITILFFPTYNHCMIEFNITEHITSLLKIMFYSKQNQGAVIGTGATIVLDAIAREIIEKISKDEEATNAGKKQKSLPPTSLLSIILSSIYGSYYLDQNLSIENKALDAAKVSLVCSILYTLWRLAIEVSTTDEDEKFGFSKNLANGIKQFILNFIAILSSHGITTREESPLWSQSK